MFQKKVLDKIKTHILCSISPPGNCTIYEMMWKIIVGARQATDDSMVHIHYILDN